MLPLHTLSFLAFPANQQHNSWLILVANLTDKFPNKTQGATNSYYNVLWYSANSVIHVVVSYYLYDLYSSGKKQRLSSLFVTSIRTKLHFGCHVS